MSWLSEAENIYASRGWKQQEHDFDCVICHEPVMAGYATEQGLELTACRDCEGKRIQQLLAAEKAFTAMKKEHRKLMLNASLALQMAANDIPQVKP